MSPMPVVIKPRGDQLAPLSVETMTGRVLDPLEMDVYAKRRVVSSRCIARGYVPAVI